MNINLLNWRDARTKKQRFYFYSLTITLIIVSLCSVYGMKFWLTQQLQLKQKNNYYLQKQINQIPLPINFILQKKAYLSLLKNLSFTRQQLHLQKQFLALLQHISEIMPASIRLTSFRKTKFHLTLQGRAKNTDSVTQFIQQLSGYHLLTKTHLVNIKNSINQSDFTIKALIKTLGQKKNVPIKKT